MTLSYPTSLPAMAQGDPASTSGRPTRAVVIGAGFAGLISAAVLAPHFAEVMLIEQDHVDDQPAQRKSLPQAAHAHALLHSGHAMLSRLFPGFEARALAAGSLRLAVRSQWRSCLRGRWVAPEDTGLHVLSQTRALLDHLLRREVSALPNVRHMHGKVMEIACNAQGHVSGLYLRGGTEGLLAASLVIDASGRAGQTDRWLAQLGVPAPLTETAYPEVRYVSAEFTRSITAGPDLAGWLNTASAPQARGGVIAPVENGRWIATASGRFDETVPEDEAGFRTFLDSLNDNRLGALLHAEHRLSEFSRYRVAATRLKRFDLSASRLPPGYLPVGDAIASFNPVYGQGLSVAALQVKCLGEVIQKTIGQDGWQERLRDGYLSQALRPARWAWLLGLANDMDFPQFTATPNHEAEYLRSALQRAFIVSTRRAEVRQAIDRILHLVAPPESVFDMPVIAEALAVKPVSPSVPAHSVGALS